MLIAFFGEPDFVETKEYQEKVAEILYKYQNERVTIIVGKEGNFDEFAWKCGQEYKKINKTARVLYISPYTGEQGEARIASFSSLYNGIVFAPEQEGTDKDEIQRRNEWMMNIADFTILYASNPQGRAYQALQYVKERKPYINLYE